MLVVESSGDEEDADHDDNPFASIQWRLVDPEPLRDAVSRLRGRIAEIQDALSGLYAEQKQLRGAAALRLVSATQRAEVLRRHVAHEEVCVQAAQLFSADSANIVPPEMAALRRQRARLLRQKSRDADLAVNCLEAEAAQEGVRLHAIELSIAAMRSSLENEQNELLESQSNLNALRNAEASALCCRRLPYVDIKGPASSWLELQQGLRVRWVLAASRDKFWPLKAMEAMAAKTLEDRGGRTLFQVEGIIQLLAMSRDVAASVLRPGSPPIFQCLDILREVLCESDDVLLVSSRVREALRGPSGYGPAHLLLQAPAALPRRFVGVLRRYQSEGFRWLAHNCANGFGCLLADDMGLGKTIQTVCLLTHFIENSLIRGPALVVAPAGLLQNWRRELAGWAPSLSVCVYSGGRTSWPRHADVVLVTYGIVRSACSDSRVVSAARIPLRWVVGALVLDEAQNVKNHGAEVSKACKRLAAQCCGPKLALSGTPVENRLEEIHSIFEVILPRYLGDLPAFRRRFSAKRGDGTANAARLRVVIEPFMLRRLKSDPGICAELPPRVDMRHDVFLCEKQERLYTGVYENCMRAISGSESKSRVRASHFFTMIHALRKVCNHPATCKRLPAGCMEHVTDAPSESGKTLEFINLLRDVLQQGEKCLVFAQYLNTIRLLQKMVAETFCVETVAFTGELTTKARDEAITRFQTVPSCMVFFATLTAGGVGLNLTAASHVVHFDRCYNPAVEDQGSDRAHRIGQTCTVVIHRFITIGTFEQRIDAIMKRKQLLREACGGSGEAAWLADYSDDGLRELFALGPGSKRLHSSRKKPATPSRHIVLRARRRISGMSMAAGGACRRSLRALGLHDNKSIDECAPLRTVGEHLARGRDLKYSPAVGLEEFVDTSCSECSEVLVSEQGAVPLQIPPIMEAGVQNCRFRGNARASERDCCGFLANESQKATDASMIEVDAIVVDSDDDAGMVVPLGHDGVRNKSALGGGAAVKPKRRRMVATPTKLALTGHFGGG